MILRDKKMLFVHVPKCAGTYIEHNLEPAADWDNADEKHLTIKGYIYHFGIDLVRKCYVFSVVRNPFERIVSYYLFHRRREHWIFDETLPDSPLMEDYYASFPAFIKHLQRFKDNMYEWAVNDMQPAFNFLDNEHSVDIDVLKLEELATWVPKLETMSGIRFTRKKINRAPGQYDFRSYYGPEELDFVYDFYKDDFRHYYPELSPKSVLV